MEYFRDDKNQTTGMIGVAEEIATVVKAINEIDPAVLAVLNRILTNQEKTTMFEDDVIAKLTAQKTIADGVKALLEQLTVLVKALPTTDPAKQAQILALIDANSQEVSDAIVANTPTTAPGPVVEPPPPAADPAA